MTLVLFMLIIYLVFIIQDIKKLKFSSRKKLLKMIILRLILGLFFSFSLYTIINKKMLTIGDINNINSIYLVISLELIFNILWNIFLLKIKQMNFSKKSMFIMICFLMILSLELTVFNYKHYLTYFNDSITIKNSDFELTNLQNKNNKYTIVNKNKYTGVKIPVDKNNINSLYVNIKNNKSDLIKYSVLIYDKESESYIDLGETTNFKNIKSSYYKTIHITNDINKIYIKIKTQNPISYYIIDNIIINPVIPLNISIIRVVLLFSLLIFIYAFRPTSQIYKIKLIDSNKSNKYIHYFIRISLLVITTIAILNPIYGKNTYVKNSDNQFHLLAESITKGHVYLNKEPTKLLAELKNPYNYYEREKKFENSKEQYLWDASYYHGKYYTYFGIVPILMIYTPFYLITGHHIYDNIVVILGLIGLFISILLLLKLIIKKYLSDISLGMFLVSLCFMVFCNHYVILYAAKRPDFYSIPIIYGIMFSIFGLYFWLKSKNENNIDNKYLLLGSLCMALVGGCRPNLLITSFLIFPIFWSDKKRLKPKNYIYLLLPFIIIGVLLMGYNYIRFDSIFEFGSKYQLTIPQRPISLEKIGLGIYYYLLAPLNLTNLFPFINSLPLNNNFLGYTFYEPTFGGVFSLCPLLIISLFWFKFKKYFNDKTLLSITKYFVIFAFFTVIFDMEIGGIIPRYFLDFNWMLALSAIIIILAVFNKYKNNQILEYLKKAVIYSMYVLIILNFFLLFTDTSLSMEVTFPQLFYRFYYAIQFWL